MMEFCERHRGSITVFLTFLVLPMMLFAELMIDFTRIYAAKTVVTGAEDLALNGCLAGFDPDLHDRYGLFAVTGDSSTVESVVQDYFEQTIDSTNLLGDDEDGYTQQLINYLKSKWSTEEEAYDNLLNLNLEDFSLNSVEGSQLLYPEALKNQIVEYMKYRGPVSLGYGFMDKLNFLSSVPKQSKAIKKETAYEKELDALQDVCLTAYTKCVGLAGKQGYWDSEGQSRVDGVQSDLETGIVRELVRGVAWISDNAKIEPLTDTFDGISKKTPEEGSVSGEKAYQTLKELMEGTDARWNDTKDTMQSAIDRMPPSEDDIPTTAAQFQSIETYFAAYKRFRDEIIGNIKYYYEEAGEYVDSSSKTDSKDDKKDSDDKASDTTDKTDTADTTGATSEDWERIKTWYNDDFKAEVEQYIEITKRDYPVKVENRVNKLMQGYARLIQSAQESVEEIVGKADAAVKALETLAKKANGADVAKQEWKAAIDNLDDGEAKTTMSSNYSTQAENMDVDKINALKAKVEAAKTYFSGINEKLKAMSVSGVKLYESTDRDFVALWKSKLGNLSGCDVTTRMNTADNLDLQIVLPDFDSLEGENSSIKEDEVYIYLEGLSNVTVDESADKETVKQNRKDIIDEGNSDSARTASLDSSSSSDSSDSSGSSGSSGSTTDSGGNIVPESGSKKVPNYSSLPSQSSKTDGSQADSADSVETMSTEDDTDKMADSATDQLGKSDSFLESLPGIIEKIQSGAELVRDDLYVMEYAMNMFSYYTINSKAETFSGDTMSRKTNELYRSEIEYLIWGGEDAQENVNKTVGMIFAIRYVLNTMYAFTDSEIQKTALSAATTLVGWTGFGVPIVKTVIILAISMAETAWDIQDLKRTENKDGTAVKEIPLLKSKSTWRLKLSNLTDALVKEALATQKDATMSRIADVTSGLNNLIGDTSKNFNDAVDKQLDASKKAIRSQVKDAILVPLQNMMVSQLTASGDVDINGKIDIVFAEIRKGCEDGTMLSEAKLTVLDAAEPAIRAKIEEKYNELRGRFNEGSITAEDISKVVEDEIGALDGQLDTYINTTKIDTFFKEKTKKIQECVSKGGANVQKEVSNMLDEMSKELGSSGDVTSDSAAKTLTMSYRDYLKVFLIINYFTGNNDGNNKVVKRIADLVQLNMSKENSGFSMDTAYTMFQVEESTGIKTLVMWMPWFNNGVANEEKRRFILKSKRIRGY